ncbi:MAG TPA: hypothetical protein VJL35_02630 [Gemmatimonadaceae bacterium]|nr:hypothetical protein [Gemmatimonadaceae bacterium]
MRRLITPTIITIAVIAGWNRVPSLVDEPGGAAAAGVELFLPTPYVIFSPFSRTLDALTLLSTAQAIALFVTIGVIVIAVKAHRGWKSGLLSLGATLLVIAALEAAAVVLPRPMAALRASDPDVVRIDFHSHSGTSHDVRKSFTVEDNRDWHRDGGFDIAYVTDHVKFAGAEDGERRNPKRAGDGTSIITGMEGRYHKIMSTIVLGITSADTALLDKRGNILPGDKKSPRQYVSVIAIPNRNLDSLSRAILDSTVALPNLRAIELIDAAPRGLAQLDREEAKLRRIAAGLNLALISASNNHGWGRTVAGWNLMTLPGWQSMPPDTVASRIENALIVNRGPVKLVHRTRPSLHGVAVAATLPVVAYQTLGTLTMPERLSWIGWTWLLALVALFPVREASTRNQRA